MRESRSFAATMLLLIRAANLSAQDGAPPQRPALSSVSAASEAKKAEPVILNTQEVMRRTPGDYPSEALDNEIGGYVLVQFSLPDDGRPQQSVVVMSDPKGVFENVALERLRIMQFAVPSEWVANHPNRRQELVFIYYVWGATPPKIPPFQAEAIALIGRKAT